MTSHGHGHMPQHVRVARVSETLGNPSTVLVQGRSLTSSSFSQALVYTLGNLYVRNHGIPPMGQYNKGPCRVRACWGYTKVIDL